jgi:hypothetical protein
MWMHQGHAPILLASIDLEPQKALVRL